MVSSGNRLSSSRALVEEQVLEGAIPLVASISRALVLQVALVASVISSRVSSGVRVSRVGASVVSRVSAAHLRVLIPAR